jgi:hypothetical protein
MLRTGDDIQAMDRNLGEINQSRQTHDTKGGLEQTLVTGFDPTPITGEGPYIDQLDHEMDAPPWRAARAHHQDFMSPASHMQNYNTTFYAVNSKRDHDQWSRFDEPKFERTDEDYLPDYDAAFKPAVPAKKPAFISPIAYKYFKREDEPFPVSVPGLENFSWSQPNESPQAFINPRFISKPKHKRDPSMLISPRTVGPVDAPGPFMATDNGVDLQFLHGAWDNEADGSSSTQNNGESYARQHDIELFTPNDGSDMARSTSLRQRRLQTRKRKQPPSGAERGEVVEEDQMEIATGR